MPPAGFFALGLVQGSLAGLNALGFVLLYRTTRLINLAQPAMGLVGGVLTGLLVVSARWSFWWAAPVGILAGALLGLGAERLVLVRLQDAPRAVLLVATVGLAQLFGAVQSALPFILGGGSLPTYTVDLGFSIDIAPFVLLGPHLLALVALPLATVAVHLFLHRSRFGMAATALGQDAERARALGVPAALVRALAWSVAGVLSSISGILAIPVLGFSLGSGIAPTVLLLALTPAVLAGMRSPVGAAAGALGLGIVYQIALYNVSRAGYADIAIAIAVIVAIALRRRQLGREGAAARASSWEAAATPRPLAWTAGSIRTLRMAGTAFAVAVAGAVVVTPRFLSPGNTVLFATSSCLALAALAVAVAWMFTGEITLGHWGFAGFGAGMAAATPGPWVVKCAVAAVAMTVAGGALGFLTRNQTGPLFAVVGLAVAVAAPVLLLTVGRRSVPTDPRPVGAAAAAICVLTAAAIVRLRGTVFGARMVAARDDPSRAPWLGADPLQTRVVALAISCGIAGLAGALYLAATPAGLAPGAFDPARSLDVLTMAVVGGLGSPAGALAGAGAMLTARLALPGPWGLLASGVGVLLVVLAVPAGLGRAVAAAREASARIVMRPPRPETVPRPVSVVQR